MLLLLVCFVVCFFHYRMTCIHVVVFIYTLSKDKMSKNGLKYIFELVYRKT